MEHSQATTPNFPGISGKQVLITGASSGLGVHFARLFAHQGAHVLAAARRFERVEALCAEIKAADGKAEPLKLDVSSFEDVTRQLDGRNLDIVINNAGVTVSASALDHGPDDIDRIIDTNLKGLLYVAQVAAKGMKARASGGNIVNITSILGHRVAGHTSAYAASKGGVLQLTRALALEWARYNIRVNALCPGYIETEINRAFFATDAGKALIKRIPQRRLGQPADLDGAILLMASDLGRFMTGADLAVDGGHLVSSL